MASDTCPRCGNQVYADEWACSACEARLEKGTRVPEREAGG